MRVKLILFSDTKNYVQQIEENFVSVSQERNEQKKFEEIQKLNFALCNVHQFTEIWKDLISSRYSAFYLRM